MTAGAVILEVRRTLNDEGGARRWPTPTLLKYVGDAEREVARLRPDLFLSSGSVMLTPSDPASSSTDVVLGEENRAVLVDLVSARALFEDSDTGNRDQAAVFEGRAYAALGVPRG